MSQTAAQKKPLYCYHVRYLNGDEKFIWAHHHEAFLGGGIAFFNKYEYKDQTVEYDFWLTVAPGQWLDWRTVEEPKKGAETLGFSPKVEQVRR